MLIFILTVHDGGEDAGMLMYVDPMDQSMVNLELLAVPEGLELDFKPFLAEREREREREREGEIKITISVLPRVQKHTENVLI